MNHIKPKCILTILSVALLSPMAFASNNIPVSDIITYPSAWIGGGVGLGYTKGNDLLLNKSIVPTFKLMAGYDFNRYLGLYSSYDYMDSRQNNSITNIYSLGFKGEIPFFDTLSVFSKIGISYLNGNTKSYNVSGSAGLGVEYKITNAISTQVGFDYYQNVDLSESRMGLNKIYWGIKYRFGQVPLPIIEVKKIETINTINTVFSKITRENYIISFPSGKATLDYEDKYTLNEVLNIMRDYPDINATIIGRADATGSVSINDTISNARSLIVYSYLTSNEIPPNRFVRKWLSNTSPIDLNSSKNSELERSVQILLR